MSATIAPPSARPAGAWTPAILVGAGVVAALSIGKLPPVLAQLQVQFSLSLVQASWMVSLFMLGAGLLGIAGGSIADRFGPPRVLVIGLLLLGLAGLTGALAPSAPVLFISRAAESVGFLLTVLPVPALLRQAVSTRRLSAWLGTWAAYMPAGMAGGLVLTPWLSLGLGWRAAWAVLALLCIAWAVLVAWALGLGRRAGHPAAGTGAMPAAGLSGLGARVWRTLRAPGPWLLCLCFLFYAGQFVGIFSFLPLVYAQYGLAASTGATLTALAVLVNVGGGVGAGMLTQAGVGRSTLLAVAGLTMASMAWVAFGSEASFAVRYAAVLTLSAVGGLIPGTLFASVPTYAPDMGTVSTTVGWMQQGSGLGQLIFPPLFALVAQMRGDWSLTWVPSGAAALVTVAIALLFLRLDRQARPA